MIGMVVLAGLLGVAQHMPLQATTDEPAAIRFQLADVPRTAVMFTALGVDEALSELDEVTQQDAEAADPVLEPVAAGADFDSAFAAFRAVRPSAPAPVSTTPLAGGRSIMNLDFNLAIRGAREGDLKVAKEVRINGRRVGEVNVAVDQQSNLHLIAEELKRVLPEDLAGKMGNSGGFVSFDTLRRGGVGIRYDPVGDYLAVAY